MRESTTSVSSGFLQSVPANRFVIFGIAAIVALLAAAAFVLVYALPDGNAFNEHVERIFIENDDLTSGTELRLLEVLAQSGTAFSDTLASYRVIILVLMVFSAALLVAAIVFLLNTVGLGRRMSEIERAGLHVKSLVVSRSDGAVRLNDLEFTVTPAALETLSVLCEAKLDGDIVSGVDIEAIVTGKDPLDCDEAAGATRIKRLRDSLGNQIVAELLVKNIARQGYVLAIDKKAIKLV